MPKSITQYEFVQKIAALPFVRGIFLFGSRARENHAERADIDIAVDCPLASENQWQQILEIIEEADTLLPIDCVRYDTLSPESPLRTNINNDMQVIYADETDS
ncbi:nucleotidyltransferase family protein [Dongshaea marina]|uniref:nucleotidyltransferase family protein n=1 Tax=Dongshaea marina TaxID=2047966 RepID=UPI000D3E8996|nr:nucleotidyltransferase domain-containing protein [Dongshaea marina]